jgi:tetratricopeptide (TPR) repeat protein
LAIREKALGPDDPAVGRSLYELADLYYMQAKWADAVRLYERWIAIAEINPRQDPIVFARSLKNIASVYRRLGRNEDAEKLERRATAILAKRPAGP